MGYKKISQNSSVSSTWPEGLFLRPFPLSARDSSRRKTIDSPSYRPFLGPSPALSSDRDSRCRAGNGRSHRRKSAVGNLLENAESRRTCFSRRRLFSFLPSFLLYRIFLKSPSGCTFADLLRAVSQRFPRVDFRRRRPSSYLLFPFAAAALKVQHRAR